MKNTKTNTEITNVNNSTNKEETTMTNTAKRNNKITRKLAAMLAAVMAMTTMATIGASANTDEVIKMNTRSAIARSASTSFTDDTKITVDEDTKMIVDLTSKTLFTFINECTPYGKFVTPALETLLGSFIGTPEDPTQKKLDEINDKLDKLFDKVDEAESSLKGFFCNELGVQSFYDDLINFKADAESINDTIQKTFKDNTLTNAQKLAKISEMIGSKTEWRANFEKNLRVLNSKLAKPSVTAEGNIFELVYNHYCKDVMFSGEALDKAKPAFDFIMETYTASCTAIIEGLSAQRWGKRDTTFWGQEYERAWYKGINIDNNGATETKVQFMDAGYDPWKELGDGFVEVGTLGKKCKNTHEWGYMKEGFVCALQKA